LNVKGGENMNEKDLKARIREWLDEGVRLPLIKVPPMKETLTSVNIITIILFVILLLYLLKSLGP
jgi:hypothetical protein